MDVDADAGTDLGGGSSDEEIEDDFEVTLRTPARHLPGYTGERSDSESPVHQPRSLKRPRSSSLESQGRSAEFSADEDGLPPPAGIMPSIPDFGRNAADPVSVSVDEDTNPRISASTDTSIHRASGVAQASRLRSIPADPRVSLSRGTAAAPAKGPPDSSGSRTNAVPPQGIAAATGLSSSPGVQNTAEESGDGAFPLPQHRLQSAMPAPVLHPGSSRGRPSGAAKSRLGGAVRQPLSSGSASSVGKPAAVDRKERPTRQTRRVGAADLESGHGSRAAVASPAKRRRVDSPSPRMTGRTGDVAVARGASSSARGSERSAPTGSSGYARPGPPSAPRAGGRIAPRRAESSTPILALRGAGGAGAKPHARPAPSSSSRTRVNRRGDASEPERRAGR
jgi:hypothetical protein